jgi:hypothetical protein
MNDIIHTSRQPHVLCTTSNAAMDIAVRGYNEALQMTIGDVYNGPLAWARSAGYQSFNERALYCSGFELAMRGCTITTTRSNVVIKIERDDTWHGSSLIRQAYSD